MQRDWHSMLRTCFHAAVSRFHDPRCGTAPSTARTIGTAEYGCAAFQDRPSALHTEPFFRQEFDLPQVQFAST